ncbi:MAG: lysophospholipid acyltransferase family protein [Mesorhizobium sp.]|nr:lysophospholipid acyltransferase family protein [Mesorhizobium sp.]
MPTKVFPELSYANAGQPRLKRWFIRSVEDLSGRDRFARLYDIWRGSIVPRGELIFSRMLELIDVRLVCEDQWPPQGLPQSPLVIVANHPFGIGDGIAVLSLAEQLGRPFRVMINAELLKVREMEPYSLPIDFSDNKDALKNNMAVRHEALRLLKEGVTIVIFPAGGVATAPSGFGVARDLPWKMFPARLVQEAKAAVIPMHFSGQNGRLFHLVSRPMLAAEQGGGRFRQALGEISLMLRTSLLIREFARLSGKSISVRIGGAIAWADLEPIRDRKLLIRHLQDAVLALAPQDRMPKRRARNVWQKLRRPRTPTALYR